MFRVTVTKSFSAAHALKIGGKCEDLHGHNFKVDVTVEGRELSPEGLLIDFRNLKRWTVEVPDELEVVEPDALDEDVGEVVEVELLEAVNVDVPVAELDVSSVSSCVPINVSIVTM